MSKRRKETWPVWKIILVAVAGVVAGAGLLWLSLHIPVPEPKAVATAPASPASPNAPTAASPLGLVHIVLLFSLLSWAVAAIFAGILIHKLYMRIPAWKRRQMFGR